MTIEHFPNQNGGERAILTACPCGYEFDDGEERGPHFLDEHRPEDFGLSPLGVIPSDVDSPLDPFDAEPTVETIDEPVATDGGEVPSERDPRSPIARLQGARKQLRLALETVDDHAAAASTRMALDATHEALDDLGDPVVLDETDQAHPPIPDGGGGDPDE